MLSRRRPQIELGIKAWSEINDGVGAVLHYLYPKQAP